MKIDFLMEKKTQQAQEFYMYIGVGEGGSIQCLCQGLFYFISSKISTICTSFLWDFELKFANVDIISLTIAKIHVQTQNKL